MIALILATGIGIYGAAYLSLVKQTSKLRNGGTSRYFVVVPWYETADSELQLLFWPAHQIDRMARPDRWRWHPGRATSRTRVRINNLWQPTVVKIPDEEPRAVRLE